MGMSETEFIQIGMKDLCGTMCPYDIDTGRFLQVCSVVHTARVGEIETVEMVAFCHDENGDFQRAWIDKPDA